MDERLRLDDRFARTRDDVKDEDARGKLGSLGKRKKNERRMRKARWKTEEGSIKERATSAFGSDDRFARRRNNAHDKKED